MFRPKFSLLEGRYDFPYEVKKKRKKKLPLREDYITHFISNFFELETKFQSQLADRAKSALTSVSQAKNPRKLENVCFHRGNQ